MRYHVSDFYVEVDDLIGSPDATSEVLATDLRDLINGDLKADDIPYTIKITTDDLEVSRSPRRV